MNVDQEILAIHTKIDNVLTILKGGHDETGKFYPGLSPRLDHIETRVRKLEDDSERANEGRLTLARGAGLAVLGGAVGQFFGWAKDHLR